MFISFTLSLPTSHSPSVPQIVDPCGQYILGDTKFSYQLIITALTAATTGFYRATFSNVAGEASVARTFVTPYCESAHTSRQLSVAQTWSSTVGHVVGGVPQQHVLVQCVTFLSVCLSVCPQFEPSSSACRVSLTTQLKMVVVVCWPAVMWRLCVPTRHTLLPQWSSSRMESL